MSRTVDTLAWIGLRIGKPPGWERVVRLLAAPEKCRSLKDVCVVRDGAMFVAQPGVPLGWHVHLFGTYEPEIRRIFRSVLTEGSVAVDVGANVGWHTLLMSRLVGASGRVVAAEANPSVRARLQANLDLNSVRRVDVIPHAIADTDGALMFHGPSADDPSSGSGHAMRTGDDRSSIRVESRRLDSIVTQTGIDRLDLIKIDVEGFEWPVLKGAAASIAKFRPHIVFEYLTECERRGGGTPDAFTRFFDEHRYRLFALGRRGPRAIRRDRWPAAANLWAVPSADADVLRLGH